MSATCIARTVVITMATFFTLFCIYVIRPTALILKQIFFSNLLVVARLERLVSIETKEYSVLAAIMIEVYDCVPTS